MKARGTSRPSRGKPAAGNAGPTRGRRGKSAGVKSAGAAPARGRRTSELRRAGLPGVRQLERLGYVVDRTGRVRRQDGRFARISSVRGAVTRERNAERGEREAERRARIAQVPEALPALPERVVRERIKVGRKTGPSARKTLERAYAAEDAIREIDESTLGETRKRRKKIEGGLDEISDDDAFVLGTWEIAAQTMTVEQRRKQLARLGQRALAEIWYRPSTTGADKEKIGELLSDRGVALRDVLAVERFQGDKKRARAQREVVKLVERSGGRLDEESAARIADGLDMPLREVWSMFFSPIMVA